MSMIKQEFAYDSAGAKAPVFLCPTCDSARIFVDVPKGGKAKIQFTFDNESFIRKRPFDVAWFNHDAGELNGDFADELFGPPTAIRLQVGEVCSPVPTILAVEQNV